MTTTSHLRRLGLLLPLALAVTACDTDMRRNLGLEKTGPDAFAVVSRAPLDLPPDYGLRPPQPGAPRPNEATPRDVARTTVFGGDPRQKPADYGDRSAGESEILKLAGADRADPTIRATVNRESLQIAQESKTLVDSLIFWREATPPGTVVNAGEEAKRLRNNASLGKPATEGDTPMIQRKNRSILEGLF